MKLFECQNCGQPLYFENIKCESCGARLGYLPREATVTALKPAGDAVWQALAKANVRYRFCENAAHDVCNCTGFRMPAVGELDACAWPASESRQGTNPRSGVHGDGALAMGIWLTRDSRDGGRAQL